jgi:hypothetical protein
MQLCKDKRFLPLWDRNSCLGTLLLGLIGLLLLIPMCNQTPAQFTRVNAQQIEGVAQPGEIVAIYDGDRQIGQATAGANGKFVFPLPANLAVGNHTFTGRIINSTGLRIGNPLLGPLAYAVAPQPTAIPIAAATAVPPTVAPTPVPPTAVPPTVAPTAVPPTVAPTVAPTAIPVVATTIDPVASNSIVVGGQLTGKSASGCDVSIMDGDVELGKAKADATGVWKFVIPTNLKAGDHVFKAVCKPSESQALTLKVITALLPVTGGN